MVVQGSPSDIASSADIQSTVLAIADRLLVGSQTLCTVESCTGGGVAAALTDVAGSSAWFEYGFVTYSNGAKSDLVGVDARLIESRGAVSREVAQAMAEGGRQRSGADFALAVTGIAGPGGGSRDKPVGTVWFAWAGPGWSESVCRLFDGDRAGIRRQATAHALEGLLARIEPGARP